MLILSAFFFGPFMMLETHLKESQLNFITLYSLYIECIHITRLSVRNASSLTQHAQMLALWEFHNL